MLRKVVSPLERPEPEVRPKGITEIYAVSFEVCVELAWLRLNEATRRVLIVVLVRRIVCRVRFRMVV